MVMNRCSSDCRLFYDQIPFSLEATRIEGCNSMNISSGRYAAILFSGDETFIKEMGTALKKRFEINTYSFNEHNSRDPLQIPKPMVILWDGRQPSSQSHQFLGWVRGHFPGCPILALRAEENSYSDLELHKRGINLILNTGAPNFLDNLDVHLRAIINDCKTIPTNAT